jgi:transcriptional regulator with GAF, ATPase, and Fis domain
MNTRRDKRKWVNEQANEEAVRKGNVKELHNIIRKLSERKYQGMQPTKNKDWALLRNEDVQRKRWQEYFKEILNPTVIKMIPTSLPLSSPIDRCDNEAEKEAEEKIMARPQNRDEIKEALKNTKK